MKWKDKFDQEFKKAYDGILSEEVLAKGNAWFKSFIGEFLKNPRILPRRFLGGDPREKKNSSTK